MSSGRSGSCGPPLAAASTSSSRDGVESGGHIPHLLLELTRCGADVAPEGVEARVVELDDPVVGEHGEAPLAEECAYAAQRTGAVGKIKRASFPADYKVSRSSDRDGIDEALRRPALPRLAFWQIRPRNAHPT